MKEYRYTDSIEAVIAYILKRILIFSPVVVICISLVLYYVNAPLKANVFLSSIPIFVLLFWLVRIGYLKTSLNILLLLSNLIVTWSCIAGNGIHDIGIILYPITVLIASVMLSRKNLILFVFMTCICLAYIVLGDIYELYEVSPVAVGRWPDVIMIGSLLLLGLVITSSHAGKLKEAIKDRITESQKQIEVGIQIEQNLEEKQQLFREVHHRVKNHLSYINSLIDMEVMTMTDVSQDQIRELQSKVIAVARLHDQLYKSDDFDKVQTKLYLEGIISQFAMSYQIADTPMRIDVEDFKMNVKKIIYLGISVHEMICLLSTYRAQIQHLEILLTKEDGSCQLTVLIQHENAIKLNKQSDKIDNLTFIVGKLNGKLDILDGAEKSILEIEF